MREVKLVEDYSYLSPDRVSLFAHHTVRQTATSFYIINGDLLTKPLAEAVTAFDAGVATVELANASHQAGDSKLLYQAILSELGRLAHRLNSNYVANERALLSSGLTLTTSYSAGTTRALSPDAEAIRFNLLGESQAGYSLPKLFRPPSTTQHLVHYYQPSRT